VREHLPIDLPGHAEARPSFRLALLALDESTGPCLEFLFFALLTTLFHYAACPLSRSPFSTHFDSPDKPMNPRPNGSFFTTCAAPMRIRNAHSNNL
jgi:hypothetical protein